MESKATIVATTITAIKSIYTLSHLKYRIWLLTHSDTVSPFDPLGIRPISASFLSTLFVDLILAEYFHERIAKHARDRDWLVSSNNMIRFLDPCNWSLNLTTAVLLQQAQSPVFSSTFHLFCFFPTFLQAFNLRWTVYSCNSNTKACKRIRN